MSGRPIPLPLDYNGILVWQPRRWQQLTAEAVGRAVEVKYQDGSDCGEMRTNGAGRIFDVLRRIYR